jgi:hypothetical protein
VGFPEFLINRFFVDLFIRSGFLPLVNPVLVIDDIVIPEYVHINVFLVFLRKTVFDCGFRRGLRFLARVF